MSDTPDGIKWHPAFYAAAELELSANLEDLEFFREYNLSKEPIRIDLLVIKDAKGTSIENEIGHIMNKYNVIEYKSPDDELSIDDFCKTVAYALLFKGYGKCVNEIPLEELTVSIFRAAYPRELFAELTRTGYMIDEAYSGIYYVKGFTVPAQIVVTGRLDKEKHSSLRILTSNADIDDIERFLKESHSRTGKGERDNIDSVLHVSMAANRNQYRNIREDDSMCPEMEELMKDVIDARVDEATQRVTQQITQEVTQQVTQQVTQEVTQQAMQRLVKFCIKFNLSFEDTVKNISEDSDMSEEEARSIVMLYWNK